MRAYFQVARIIWWAGFACLIGASWYPMLLIPAIVAVVAGIWMFLHWIGKQ